MTLMAHLLSYKLVKVNIIKHRLRLHFDQFGFCSWQVSKNKLETIFKSSSHRQWRHCGAQLCTHWNDSKELLNGISTCLPDTSKIAGWQKAWVDNQVYSGGDNNCEPGTRCGKRKIFSSNFCCELYNNNFENKLITQYTLYCNL